MINQLKAGLGYSSAEWRHCWLCNCLSSR